MRGALAASAMPTPAARVCVKQESEVSAAAQSAMTSLAEQAARLAAAVSKFRANESARRRELATA
jgi:hypothetical protein